MFENDYLMHYGIKGQKWGVRRYQNADGSLTTAGRARYSKGSGKRARYGSENTMDPNKAARVEKLNKKIDKLNLKMQKGTARSYGYGDLSVGKQAALRGAVGAGTAGVAGYAMGSRTAKAYNALNAHPIVKGYQFTTDAGGNTIMVPSVVAGASKINPVAAGLKTAIPYATAAGLTNAVGGAILGAAAKGIGSHDVFRKGRERTLQKLQAERNALDSSQKNRKGRILTKEEFNKQFNGAKGGVTGLNVGGLVGGAVGAAIGKRSKKDNVYDYEQYKKNAVAYGKKKTKYGSEGMSSEVYNLNKKIDNYNRQLQNTRVMNDAIRGTSVKKMAALQGTKGTAVNAALGASSLAEVPLGAAAGFLGGAGLLNAAMGAGVTAGMKRNASKGTNEKIIEKKIKKLQEKRNALDPRQANRQGSLLSKEEYNKLYNAGKGSMYGFGAGGLLGGIAGSVIGSRSKKINDAEYENYKNNAVSYGSKKKKRAR